MTEGAENRDQWGARLWKMLAARGNVNYTN
jgi:hypothetical protein